MERYIEKERYRNDRSENTRYSWYSQPDPNLTGYNERTKLCPTGGFTKGMQWTQRFAPPVARCCPLAVSSARNV